MFYRGQKVVYIGYGKLSWLQRAELWLQRAVFPKVGEVYTVANIYQGPTKLLIELVEVVKLAELAHPWGYKPRRFRPVVERKTDIGFAHEILRNVTKRVGADA